MRNPRLLYLGSYTFFVALDREKRDHWAGAGGAVVDVDVNGRRSRSLMVEMVRDAVAIRFVFLAR